MSDSFIKKTSKISPFAESYSFSLHVICLEAKKRLIHHENHQILIWPVEEFLKTLWSGEIWK